MAITFQYKHITKTIIFLIVAIMFSLSSCDSNQSDEYPQIQKIEELELFVASEKLPAIAFDACTGNEFEIDAFAVKQSKNDEWEAFTGHIKEFNYISGIEYQIQIKKEELFDPRRSVQHWEEYTLIEIISQEQKKSENLPDTFVP